MWHTLPCLPWLILGVAKFKILKNSKCLKYWNLFSLYLKKGGRQQYSSVCPYVKYTLSIGILSPASSDRSHPEVTCMSWVWWPTWPSWAFTWWMFCSSSSTVYFVCFGGLGGPGKYDTRREFTCLRWSLLDWWKEHDEKPWNVFSVWDSLCQSCRLSTHRPEPHGALTYQQGWRGNRKLTRCPLRAAGVQSHCAPWPDAVPNTGSGFQIIFHRETTATTYTQKPRNHRLSAHIQSGIQEEKEASKTTLFILAAHTKVWTSVYINDWWAQIRVIF